MLDRVRRSLVDSYIGAIALGLLMAELVSHLVNIFEVPIASWIVRNLHPEFYAGKGLGTAFSLRESVPDLTKFVLKLVIWLLCLRWLYLRSPEVPAKEV